MNDSYQLSQFKKLTYL